MKDNQNAILLLEYEKAQDAANHLNQISWTITSLSFVFLGVLITISNELNKLPISIKSLFFIAFTIFWGHISWLFIKSQKRKIEEYVLCWEIGNSLDMKRKLNRPEHNLLAYSIYLIFMLLFWFIFYFMLFGL